MWRIIDTMQEFIDRQTGVRSIMCEIAADTAADLPANSAERVFILGTFATAIDTGDIYKINSAGAWILQPSQNAFSNVYTKAEIDSMVNVIYQVMMYYHNEQESTDGTITFYTLGGNVGNLTIYGNGHQNGTPTPDNPVMPTFCGVRTANLWDPNSRVTNQVGQLNWGVVLPAGTYTIKNDSAVTVYYRNGLDATTASRFANAGDTVTKTTTNDMVAWCNSSQPNIMLNTGSTTLPYEPYGYKIPLTCAGQTTPLYLGEVSTVRRIKKMILDGTETTTEESANVYSIPISDTVIAGAGVSTHFAYDASTADGQFQIESRKAVFGYDDTLENFKAFLAAQYAAGTPVTVWYVLAEPETSIVNEPLCKIGDYSDELHLTKDDITIPTVSGENTLTVDTELPPSKIIISGE